jgi:hypothetical protein
MTNALTQTPLTNRHLPVVAVRSVVALRPRVLRGPPVLC